MGSPCLQSCNRIAPKPQCDGTVTIVEGEYRFFTLVIWAVFKPVCARFRIQAAELHGWFLFFSFLAFPLVSFGLWTANPMQVSDFFALITLGLDRATFVRSMSVCSTTSVAAESFCLWSPRSVHVVDLDRVFSGALRQQSRFLHGRFCIPHNSHGFGQVKVFLLGSFCFKVWEEQFPTIWSLIMSSSKVPKSQDFTSSRRFVRYASNNWSAFCALDLNL